MLLIQFFSRSALVEVTETTIEGNFTQLSLWRDDYKTRVHNLLKLFTIIAIERRHMSAKWKVGGNSAHREYLSIHWSLQLPTSTLTQIETTTYIYIGRQHRYSDFDKRGVKYQFFLQ